MVTVKTTLPTIPYPPLEERAAIITERLILRPFRADDVHSLYAMQSDKEIMVWSATGKAYTTIEQSQKVLDKKLSEDGRENQDYVICLATTGEMIGFTGSHQRCGSLGWPEIGYTISREHWGKGYATESLLAFLDFWWTLPRSECELQVEKCTLDDKNSGDTATECIVTITVEGNQRSRTVMRKGRLELVKLLTVPDLRDETRTIDLFCHAARRPAVE